MQLIAIDIETTGLDPKYGTILEIAAFKLDSSLTILDTFNAKVANAPLHQMDNYVTKMHTVNGLLAAPVTSSLLDFKLWAGRDEIVFLGNSVHFDRSWILEHCPTLDVSHRVIDISSFYRFCLYLGCNTESEAKPSTHRAMDDLQACMVQARHYAEQLK